MSSENRPTNQDRAFVDHRNMPDVTMTLHLSNSRSIGSVIDDGIHSPYRALACSLKVTKREESPLDSAQSRQSLRRELQELFA